MNSIGKQVLNALKGEINEIDYQRYIKQLTFDEAESKSNLAIFRAPNALIANWVRTKFADKIAHLFEIKTNIKPAVSILIQSSSAPSSTQNTVVASNVERPSGSLLNPSFTFQNFVVGDSNNFAFIAAKNVSEKPGVVYNPLFIYGGVGLGKTHLMQSVGNVMLSQGKTVIYTSVEQFLNDFTRHLSNRTMD
ncbi:DnaA/Hda family protein, partial [Sulfuricurvum sp.]|uniref:DnaA ATPase domain-containing protein n=1 Tax=Sulfuricurvum sp. TaxID=2025608 RepID=UPI0025E81881